MSDSMKAWPGLGGEPVSGFKEPRAVLPPGYVLEINFTDFYDMIKKAFIDQATRTHMDAIFEARRLPGELEDSSVLPPSRHQ